LGILNHEEMENNELRELKARIGAFRPWIKTTPTVIEQELFRLIGMKIRLEHELGIKTIKKEIELPIKSKTNKLF
jgi:hypothetical protein